MGRCLLLSRTRGLITQGSRKSSPTQLQAALNSTAIIHCSPPRSSRHNHFAALIAIYWTIHGTPQFPSMSVSYSALLLVSADIILEVTLHGRSTKALCNSFPLATRLLPRPIGGRSFFKMFGSQTVKTSYPCCDTRTLR